MNLLCYKYIFVLSLLLISLADIAQKPDTVRYKNHILALPVVSRSIETDWSFGAALSYTFQTVKKKDSTTRTSNLQSISYYTLRKQFLVAMDAAIYFPKEKYILNTHFSYSSFPDKFWGLGRKTSEGDAEPYSFKQFYIYLHGQKLLEHRFFIGLLYEYQKLIDIDYVAGGLFDQQNIAGRQPYHVSGLGSSFSYDNRNSSFWPTHGGMYQFSFNHFDKIFASDFQYTNFILDLRKFWKLKRSQVIAGQFYGFFNAGDVPLRSLANFGGTSSMRGYYNGRFRDKNQVVLQAEYRVPVIWRFGVVAFAGMGDVCKKLSELDLLHMKYSVGGGLRFSVNKSEKMNLRLDYGIGSGRSNGFYIQFGEAF